MNDVSRNLDDFIESGLDNRLKAAMMEAVSLVQKNAKNRAPIGDTGALKRSIDIDVEEDGTKGVVFSNLEYAPYVEIGTGIHSSKGNGRKEPWVYKGSHGWVTTKGSKPQPFLEPAVNENTDNIINCFEGLF